MALKELRVCDVYGTTKDVQPFRLILERAGAAANPKPETVIESYIDLCPRALDRLVKFVNRGSNPVKDGETVEKAS